MNIELTTENLRKSCRVCLSQGDFNMWKHYITLKDETNSEIERTSDITAIDLFNIYENYNNSLLGLDTELELLCFSCLSELTNSYIFYKKASHSNIRIQSLYKEAQKIEAEQLVDVVVEVLQNEFSNESNLDVEFELADETRTDVSIEDYMEQVACEEQVQLDDNSTVSSVNSSATDQTVNNKSITDLIKCGNDIVEESQGTVTEIHLDEINPIKRQSPYKPHRDKASGPTLPPHEEGALVVTQFLPSTAHIVLDTRNSPAVAIKEDERGGSEIIHNTPELNTVDYAAVEVRSSNLQQVIEEELQLQNIKPLSPENAYTLDNCTNKEQLTESENSVYFCKFCPQAFAAPHYLIAHVKKSHVCKYCTQPFTKSMDLFVHIRQAHHQHKCAICHKELSSHSNLRGHIKRVHGIRLPAQVALLDYRPPNGKSSEEKTYNSSTMDNAVDEMNMYF